MCSRNVPEIHLQPQYSFQKHCVLCKMQRSNDDSCTTKYVNSLNTTDDKDDTTITVKQKIGMNKVRPCLKCGKNNLFLLKYKKLLSQKCNKAWTNIPPNCSKASYLSNFICNSYTEKADIIMFRKKDPSLPKILQMIKN